MCLERKKGRIHSQATRNGPASNAKRATYMRSQGDDIAQSAMPSPFVRPLSSDPVEGWKTRAKSATR